MIICVYIIVYVYNKLVCILHRCIEKAATFLYGFPPPGVKSNSP